MDIKVFIHTDTDLRLLRRISRDMKERSRSIDSVVDQYTTTVRPMHSQFVEPNKKYADLIISGNTQNFVGLDLIVTKINSHIQNLQSINQ